MHQNPLNNSLSFTCCRTFDCDCTRRENLATTLFTPLYNYYDEKYACVWCTKNKNGYGIVNNSSLFLLQEIKDKMHVSEFITIHYCERTMWSDFTSSLIATNGWKETKMARKQTEGEAQAGVSVVGMHSLDR